MDPERWRIVVVRAWRHEAQVAAVLLVGAEPDADEPVRQVAVGSIEAACAELAAVLGELTQGATEPPTRG